MEGGREGGRESKVGREIEGKGEKVEGMNREEKGGRDREREIGDRGSDDM